MLGIFESGGEAFTSEKGLGIDQPDQEAVLYSRVNS
jgi:hypothetical protein